MGRAQHPVFPTMGKAQHPVFPSMGQPKHPIFPATGRTNFELGLCSTITHRHANLFQSLSGSCFERRSAGAGGSRHLRACVLNASEGFEMPTSVSRDAPSSTDDRTIPLHHVPSNDHHLPLPLFPSDKAMDIKYTSVQDFTPNLGEWKSIGKIVDVSPPPPPDSAIGEVPPGAKFTLTTGDKGAVIISFLSSTCFRVYFDPTPGIAGQSQWQSSPAVVTMDLEDGFRTYFAQKASQLSITTEAMSLEINLDDYALRVFKDGQLISSDMPSYSLVYIPGQAVIANFKERAPGSYYFGFGEKAGAQLAKNEVTMTQFNYDNYRYAADTVPSGTTAGPLNPSVALYTSIPFVLEVNPSPSGNFAGKPFACGIFLDNTSQSYFNMGANDYSDMDGKFYFGALFGPMDYYFFLGDGAPDVLRQYTTLTGRAPMLPKYALGYHQGCYGYYDKSKIEEVAKAYRQARIPCDGLHIDVDFQDNYRTFTHSEEKFRDAPGMMKGLHDLGFKCSTNITPFLTDNALNENGTEAVFQQRQNILDMGGLISNTYAGQSPSSDLFEGQLSYGVNSGTNPYPYPPLRPDQNGETKLSFKGNYPDFGRADVRKVWGEQYAHLINNVGMDMIWQDMMCPALDGTKFANGTFPLTLMLNDSKGYVPHGVSHNAYGLLLLEATWAGLKTLRGDTRNFIIARGGYAGMQRYAALWTGDSASTWDFLAINLPEVLNLGLSGVPLSGCDIGGYAEDIDCSPGPYYVDGKVYGAVANSELLTRWMHLGSFLPWYRNHYHGYKKQFQEPFAYPEPVPSNCRKFVELRYRMLQIHYDAYYEWTQTGMPMARAMFLNDSNDPQVFAHLNDQFFVGGNFLVAPILSPGQGSPSPVAMRSVYLPTGSNWYAFMDNAATLAPAVPGGTLIENLCVGLDQVPMYVRAGAILPMRSKVEQYVGELPQNPLDITVYPGPDAAHTLYQDDGISTEAEASGTYRTAIIAQYTMPGNRTIMIERVHDAYAPPEKFLLIRFLFDAAFLLSDVMVNDRPVQAVGSNADLEGHQGPAYVYDQALGNVVVKVMDDARILSTSVLYSKN